MKLALVLLCCAVALPAVTHAFLFGVTITDAAGAVFAATNPAQTGIIVTIGILGASLAFAAGALASQLFLPPEDELEYIGYVEAEDSHISPYASSDLLTSSSASASPYSRRAGSYRTLLKRSRREEAKDAAGIAEVDVDGVFDTIFVDIHKSKMEGCFERLVCDIAARPGEYQRNIPIIMGVEMIETHSLTSEATLVSRRLVKALKYGQSTQDVRACEETYSKCHWTGQQMDQVISQFDKKVTIEP